MKKHKLKVGHVGKGKSIRLFPSHRGSYYSNISQNNVLPQVENEPLIIIFDSYSGTENQNSCKEQLQNDNYTNLRKLQEKTQLSQTKKKGNYE